MNTKQNKMRHVAVYYRVSTDKQDIQMQKDAIGKYFESLPEDQKPESIVEFMDEGISGAKEDRPAFLEMLTAAFQGCFDTIVVYKLDRFSRDAGSAIVTILELDKAGVTFISTSQPILNIRDNPFGRTMLSAFADIAQIERESIVARIKDGLASAKAKGVKLGRKYQIKQLTRENIVIAFKELNSYSKVARKFHISRGAVYKIVKNAQAVA